MVYEALKTDGIWSTYYRWYTKHLRHMVYDALKTDGIWST